MVAIEMVATTTMPGNLETKKRGRHPEKQSLVMSHVSKVQKRSPQCHTLSTGLSKSEFRRQTFRQKKKREIIVTQ